MPRRTYKFSKLPTSRSNHLTDSRIPLLDHPVIAISLILMVASLAQLGVWIMNAGTPPISPPPQSSLIVYTVPLAELVSQHLGQPIGEWLGPRYLYVLPLLLAFAAAIPWYFACRLAMGPGWAVWACLLFFAHPAFAFLIQQSPALTLMTFLLPTVWAFLLAWRKKHNLLAAAMAGMVLAITALVSLQVVILLPLVLLAVLLHPGIAWTTRMTGFLTILLGFAIILVGEVSWIGSKRIRTHLHQDLPVALWKAFDAGDGSQIARDARDVLTSDTPQTAPLRPFIHQQLTQHPLASTTWLLKRAWKSLHGTSDVRFDNLFWATQSLGLLPALWGSFVALRCKHWRWAALTGWIFIFASWLPAALAEPLLQNLTPVGGIALMFALIGLADIYERLFGRRLIEPEENNIAW